MTNRTAAYAVRDVDTKERLSYRYDDRKDAEDRMAELAHNGRVMEVYKTTRIART